MKKKLLIVIPVVIATIVVAGFSFRENIIAWFLRPTQSTIDQGINTESASQDIETVKTGLETPWSIEFLPSGDLLATERSGRLQRIGSDGQAFPISGVRETSEGGLLGVALHPDFEQNNQLYLYITTDKASDLENTVDLYSLRNDTLNFERTIIKNIPAAANHNGGGIAFGPDQKLYITTGDALEPELAQDTNSVAGKILRLNDDGSVPSDNPFNNPVWSYGHRNPQGIAWDDQDRLWSVEHGPSGRDELNLIAKGNNYGWPNISGDEIADGMISPIIQSGNDETWAPSALTFYKGSLYFAGLRGQSLYQAKINNNDSVSLKRHFSSEYGRLRAVNNNNDRIYFSTSNRDGRGNPSQEDDRIISVSVKVFE